MSDYVEVYPFSEKGNEFISLIDEPDIKYYLLNGAIASGKSVVVAFATILYAQQLPPNAIIALIGPSAGTASQVLLENLRFFLNMDGSRHFNGDRPYYRFDYPGLEDKKFIILGAGKMTNAAIIKGMTFDLAVMDEVDNFHPEVFNIILGRLRKKHSKAFMSFNPKHPGHWLKKWIDEYKDDSNVRLWNYNLDDNLSLSDKIKDDLKRKHTGVLYKRFILGEWAAGDDLIFNVDNINIEKINTADIAKKYNKLIYGIDFGTTNPTACVEVYITKERGKNHYWVTNEYKKNKLAPSQFADDIVLFIKRNYNNIYIDPAAHHFKLELVQRKLYVSNSRNNVMEGIIKLDAIINEGRLHIDESCQELIKEFNSYSWDPNKVDQPIKENDHLLDALRYALVMYETTNIKVLT